MTDTIIDAIAAPLPKNYRRRWRRVLWRTVQSMTSMDTSMRCAGVAYFGFLSMIPAVATVVLLIGLFAKPSFLADMVGRLDGLIPVGDSVPDDATSFVSVGADVDLDPRWDGFGNIELSIPPDIDIYRNDDNVAGISVIYR